MADPDHVPELDAFDRFTVRAYRTGLGVATLGVTALGIEVLVRGTHLASVVVLLGSLLAAADLHLYDKRIRWLIGAFAHLGSFGLVLVGLSGAPILHWAALGCLFVVLSALALKERFCFRVPGLRAVPALLALSLVPAVFGAPSLQAALLLAAAVPLALLTVAKLRMPVHFDIGNKAHYQV